MHETQKKRTNIKTQMCKCANVAKLTDPRINTKVFTKRFF